MNEPDFSRLSRKINSIPDFVSDAISEAGLLAAYRRRPAYQQNDYLGWITRAKKRETRLKRLDQMLYELQRGDVYMNMRWNSDR